MYKQIYKLSLMMLRFKKNIILRLGLIALITLQSCAMSIPFALQTADWAKGKQINHVLVIDEGSNDESFKNDFLYDFRQTLAERGVINHGINYSEKMLNAEETLAEKISETKPDYIIHLKLRAVSYVNNGTNSYMYMLKVHDQTNKAVMLRTVLYTTDSGAKAMSRRIISILEKSQMIPQK